MAQADKIRERFEWEAFWVQCRAGLETAGAGVEKPKRMRWVTYYRMLERANDYDLAALGMADPWFERMSARLERGGLRRSTG